MALCSQINNVFSFDRSLKWVLAEYSDFSYNLEMGKIPTNDPLEVGIDEFMELANNLENLLSTQKNRLFLILLFSSENKTKIFIQRKLFSHRICY